MRYSRRIKSCLWLAIILTPCLRAIEGKATELTAPPLPHASDLKQTSSCQQIVPRSSRFYAGNDFRDEERRQQQAEVKAAQQAELDRKRAIDEAKLNAKQASQASIDANNRAVQLGRQGRWSEAIQEHEKAVQLDPRNKAFRINLSAACTAYGEQRLAHGDASSASHLFRQALAIAPD